MNQQERMRIARVNVAKSREEPGAVTVSVTVVPTETPTLYRWIMEANMEDDQRDFIAACGFSLAQPDKGEPTVTLIGDSQDVFVRLHDATTAFITAIREYSKVINTPA